MYLGTIERHCWSIRSDYQSVLNCNDEGGVCNANEIGVFEEWRGGEPVNAL